MSKDCSPAASLSDEVSPADCPEHPPRSPSERSNGPLFVVIHVMSAIVIIVPAFVLYFYMQAAGGALGWWSNDSTNDDGATAPILIALAALGICLGIAVVTARVARRFVRLSQPNKSLALAFVGVVLALVLAIWWYLAAWK